jgi:hypothetical protein
MLGTSPKAMGSPAFVTQGRNGEVNAPTRIIPVASFCRPIRVRRLKRHPQFEPTKYLMPPTRNDGQIARQGFIAESHCIGLGIKGRTSGSVMSNESCADGFGGVAETSNSPVR